GVGRPAEVDVYDAVGSERRVGRPGRGEPGDAEVRPAGPADRPDDDHPVLRIGGDGGTGPGRGEDGESARAEGRVELAGRCWRFPGFEGFDREADSGPTPTNTPANLVLTHDSPPVRGIAAPPGPRTRPASGFSARQAAHMLSPAAAQGERKLSE